MPSSQNVAETRAKLEHMGELDQSVRHKWSEVEEKARAFAEANHLDINSPEFNKLPEVIKIIEEAGPTVLDVDADNLAFVQNLLDTSGWPDRPTYGDDACEAVFLILQHAEIGSDVRNHYLPMATKAYHEGNLNPQNYALYLDRWQVDKRGTQMFGTQYHYSDDRSTLKFYPIADLKNVDRRRALYGLPSLADQIGERQKRGDEIELPPKEVLQHSRPSAAALNPEVLKPAPTSYQTASNLNAGLSQNG